MPRPLSRRQFLQTTALAGTSLLIGGGTRASQKLSANEKLNLGVIGTANRARANLSALQGENIVALCDVDENFLAAAKEKLPGAKTYNDFRKLLEQKELDAVLVSTADHTHAVATAAALHLGKHVY